MLKNDTKINWIVKLSCLILGALFLVCMVFPAVVYNGYADEPYGVNDVINGGLYDQQSDKTKIVDDNGIFYTYPKFDKMTESARQYYECFVNDCDGEGKAIAVLLLLGILLMGGVTVLVLLSLLIKQDFYLFEAVLATMAAALCIVALFFVVSLKKYTPSIVSGKFVVSVGYGLFIMLGSSLVLSAFCIAGFLSKKFVNLKEA